MNTLQSEWVIANQEKILNDLERNPNGLSVEEISSDTNIFEPSLTWLLDRLASDGKIRIVGYSQVWSRWSGNGTQAHYALV